MPQETNFNRVLQASGWKELKAHKLLNNNAGNFVFIE